MNKHLRALIIVLGIVAVGLGITFFVKARQDAAMAVDTEKPVIALNQSMPDFESKTILDKSLKLSQFKGKVVILNFWASWCGPCVEEMPSLIKLVQTFPKDIELVAISGDSTIADIESFIKSFPELKTQANIHVIFDEDKKLSQQYQVFRLPESYVLNKDQKMVKKISGTINWNTEEALQYMGQLIHPQAANAPAAAPAAPSEAPAPNAPEIED
jgi:thiol-disulfide isomerase/thioredoxin